MPTPAPQPAVLSAPRRTSERLGRPHELGLPQDEIDLPALARAAHATAGVPLNVEVVRLGKAAGTLEMRVFERGVGETAACGTGSCASAAVARRAGLVGDHVVVLNPGGPLEVDLGASDDDPVHLGGPVRVIAEVFVEAGMARGDGE